MATEESDWSLSAPSTPYLFIISPRLGCLSVFAPIPAPLTCTDWSVLFWSFWRVDHLHSLCSWGTYRHRHTDFLCYFVVLRCMMLFLCLCLFWGKIMITMPFLTIFGTILHWWWDWDEMVYLELYLTPLWVYS
jgi:hypothetical protein